MLIVLAALFVGLSIGANDAGNAIGTVVGSEVLSFRKAAYIVVVFALIGGLLSGSGVSKTVGDGIIPSKVMQENKVAVFTALLSAGLLVFAITLLGIPISMTQTIIGAVLGIGFAVGVADQMNYPVILKILSLWIMSPIAAAVTAILIYRLFITPLLNHTSLVEVDTLFKFLCIFSAVFMAYNFGANDVSNAVGLVSSSGVVTSRYTAVVLLALALGFGVLLFSSRIVDTLGKRITPLSPASAFTSQISAALTVFFFVLIGVPVSTTQAVVGGVVGVGLNKSTGAVNTKTLRNIILGWVCTPLLACAASIILYKLMPIG